MLWNINYLLSQYGYRGGNVIEEFIVNQCQILSLSCHNDFTVFLLYDFYKIIFIYVHNR